MMAGIDRIKQKSAYLGYRLRWALPFCIGVVVSHIVDEKPTHVWYLFAAVAMVMFSLWAFTPIKRQNFIIHVEADEPPTV